MDSMVGQYARVRMVQGSLLVVDSVQARPLVDPSKVLMSVPVPLSGVPTGLREGSRLVLIVTPKTAGAAAPPVLVEATVAAVPRNLGELVGGGDSNQSTVALSVEVPPESAAVVGVGRRGRRRGAGRGRPVPGRGRSGRRGDAVDVGGGWLMGGVVAVCAAAGTVDVDDVRSDVGVVDAVGAAGAVRRVRPVGR